MNYFLKLIGYKHNYGGGENSYSFTWGEIALFKYGFGCRMRGSEYCHSPKLIFELFFITIFLKSPFDFKQDKDGNGQTYGFYTYPSFKSPEALVLEWGHKRLHIDMPWTYKWYSTELLDWDYKTIYEDRVGKRSSWEEQFSIKEKWIKSDAKTFDYTYTLKNGTVQHRKATCIVERRTWKMRGWPWKKYAKTTLEVTFNDEVGERTGSWKGGTIGCGYEMLPGETAEQTLRRMERERTL